MTLTDFIIKLQELERQGHGGLLVALSDWGEQCRASSVDEAEFIKVVNARYTVVHRSPENSTWCRRVEEGPHIQIGDWPK